MHACDPKSHSLVCTEQKYAPIVTSRQKALSGSICNNPSKELSRCPYRQQNTLNTMEQ